MIVINKTLHVINHDDNQLMPGSNVVKSGFDKKHPIIKALIEDGQLEIIDEVKNESQAIEAIKNANGSDILENVMDEVGDKVGEKEKVKKAATKRQNELDDFDAQVDAAMKKNKEQD